MRLEAYCRALLNWSPRAGLVSAKDMPNLVRTHLGASLGPLLIKPPRTGECWIDVGTGGGLPGLVLKLCRPDLDMTLVDSSRKKTIFLERVRELLEVKRLAVIQARAETLRLPSMEEFAEESAEKGLAQRVVGGSVSEGSPLARGPKGEGNASADRFETILMRAVAPLSKALSLIDGIAAPGTTLITYKGMEWETEAEAARPVMDQLGWRLEEALQIPWAPPKLLRLKRIAPR